MSRRTTNVEMKFGFNPTVVKITSNKNINHENIDNEINKSDPKIDKRKLTMAPNLIKNKNEVLEENKASKPSKISHSLLYKTALTDKTTQNNSDGSSEISRHSKQSINDLKNKRKTINIVGDSNNILKISQPTKVKSNLSKKIGNLKENQKSTSTRSLNKNGLKPTQRKDRSQSSKSPRVPIPTVSSKNSSHQLNKTTLSTFEHNASYYTPSNKFDPVYQNKQSITHRKTLDSANQKHYADINKNIISNKNSHIKSNENSNSTKTTDSESPSQTTNNTATKGPFRLSSAKPRSFLRKDNLPEPPICRNQTFLISSNRKKNNAKSAKDSSKEGNDGGDAGRREEKVDSMGSSEKLRIIEDLDNLKTSLDTIKQLITFDSVWNKASEQSSITSIKHENVCLKNKVNELEKKLEEKEHSIELLMKQRLNNDDINTTITTTYNNINDNDGNSNDIGNSNNNSKNKDRNNNKNNNNNKVGSNNENNERDETKRNELAQKSKPQKKQNNLSRGENVTNNNNNNNSINTNNIDKFSTIVPNNNNSKEINNNNNNNNNNNTIIDGSNLTYELNDNDSNWNDTSSRGYPNNKWCPQGAEQKNIKTPNSSNNNDDNNNNNNNNSNNDKSNNKNIINDFHEINSNNNIKNNSKRNTNNNEKINNENSASKVIEGGPLFQPDKSSTPLKKLTSKLSGDDNDDYSEFIIRRESSDKKGDSTYKRSSGSIGKKFGLQQDGRGGRQRTKSGADFTIHMGACYSLSMASSRSSSPSVQSNPQTFSQTSFNKKKDTTAAPSQSRFIPDPPGNITGIFKMSKLPSKRASSSSSLSSQKACITDKVLNDDEAGAVNETFDADTVSDRSSNFLNRYNSSNRNHVVSNDLSDDDDDDDEINSIFLEKFVDASSLLDDQFQSLSICHEEEAPKRHPETTYVSDFIKAANDRASRLNDIRKQMNKLKIPSTPKTQTTNIPLSKSFSGTTTTNNCNKNNNTINDNRNEPQEIKTSKLLRPSRLSVPTRHANELVDKHFNRSLSAKSSKLSMRSKTLYNTERF